MLFLLLAVKIATTHADLVRYAAAQGVKVTTANPATVVSPAQEKAIKSWIDGVGWDHHFHDHDHDHHHEHRSPSDPH